MGVVVVAVVVTGLLQVGTKDHQVVLPTRPAITTDLQVDTKDQVTRQAVILDTKDQVAVPRTHPVVIPGTKDQEVPVVVDIKHQEAGTGTMTRALLFRAQRLTCLSSGNVTIITVVPMEVTAVSHQDLLTNLPQAHFQWAKLVILLEQPAILFYQ